MRQRRASRGGGEEQVAEKMGLEKMGLAMGLAVWVRAADCVLLNTVRRGTWASNNVLVVI